MFPLLPSCFFTFRFRIEHPNLLGVFSLSVRVSASVRWGGIIRDSIAGMWERFSLTEKEGQKIKISGEVEATGPINVEAVMRTFLPVKLSGSEI